MQRWLPRFPSGSIKDSESLQALAHLSENARVAAKFCVVAEGEELASNILHLVRCLRLPARPQVDEPVHAADQRTAANQVSNGDRHQVPDEAGQRQRSGDVGWDLSP